MSNFYGANPPGSPDIIHFKDDSVIFIEFKNGAISNREHKMDLKLKGIEGGFIALYEITSKENPGITFEEILKLKKEYIIVYNSERNEPENQVSSRVSTVVGHLQSNNIRFRLDKYWRTFFHELSTVNEIVFMQNRFKKL